jgi:hypothetical protein
MCCLRTKGASAGEAPSNELIFCRDCGAKDLDVFYTSRQHGYHLCSDCFQLPHRRTTGQWSDAVW